MGGDRMSSYNRQNIRIHSDVPYVVKKQHVLDKDNTIVVKNENGFLNQMKKMFRGNKKE